MLSAWFIGAPSFRRENEFIPWLTARVRCIRGVGTDARSSRKGRDRPGPRAGETSFALRAKDHGGEPRRWWRRNAVKFRSSCRGGLRRQCLYAKGSQAPVAVAILMPNAPTRRVHKIGEDFSGAIRFVGSTFSSKKSLVDAETIPGSRSSALGRGKKKTLEATHP